MNKVNDGREHKVVIQKFPTMAKIRVGYFHLQKYPNKIVNLRVIFEKDQLM